VWCPECGDEFRDGFRRCTYCDAELVALRPTIVKAAAQPESLVRTDHVLLEYDLSDWSEDHRQGLSLQLRLAEIPAEWEDGRVLLVGRAWQDAVDELVDFVDEEQEEDDTNALPAHPDAGFILASPGRRFLGAVVDQVAISPVIWLVVRSAPPSLTRFLIGFVASALYWILPVALWGRTIGKLVVGTRVMRTDELISPGWRVAIVRWSVVAVPDLVAIPLGVAGFFVAWVCVLLIYAPILGPARRGLHDRAAGTQVVLTSWATDPA